MSNAESLNFLFNQSEPNSQCKTNLILMDKIEETMVTSSSIFQDAERQAQNATLKAATSNSMNELKVYLSLL